jgi:hypothetical protein
VVDSQPYGAILAAVILVSLVLGCSDAAGSRTRAENNEPHGELRVGFGQTVMFQRERLKIKFAALVNDSRCPTDVTCVLEGDAEIVVEARRANDESQNLRLHTNQRFAQRGQYQRYEITLVGLAPYPRSDTERESRDYVATLMVKRE